MWRSMKKYNYKPSAKELRFSLKSRSREYFLENSLHGVQYIVDPTRPKWERIIWLVLTLASLGATIGIIVIIWRKFQTEPTITGITAGAYSSAIIFPQLFICYDWNQLNTTLIPESEKDVYEKLYHWSWKNASLEGMSNYMEKDNFREVFKSIMPNCNSVLHNCDYNGLTHSCGTVFEQVLLPYGACCKYNGTKSMTASEAPWKLQFEALTYPLRIFLTSTFAGDPQRGDRPMFKLGSALTLHFDVYITLAVNIESLMRRQRKCHFPSEQEPYFKCRHQCINQHILKYCACLPWFLKLDNEQECPVAKYPCVTQAYLRQTCECLLPCTYSSYVPSKVDFAVEGSKLSSIQMESWPWIYLERETRFGYLDLLVSFGGIGGLFLGYSLLTSVELGYYFSLRAYCGAVVDSSRRKHNISTIHVIEAKRMATPDIKPIYYQYVE